MGLRPNGMVKAKYNNHNNRLLNQHSTYSNHLKPPPSSLSLFLHHPRLFESSSSSLLLHRPRYFLITVAPSISCTTTPATFLRIEHPDRERDGWDKDDKDGDLVDVDEAESEGEGESEGEDGVVDGDEDNDDVDDVSSSSEPVPSLATKKATPVNPRLSQRNLLMHPHSISAPQITLIPWIHAAQRGPKALKDTDTDSDGSDAPTMRGVRFSIPEQTNIQTTVSTFNVSLIPPISTSSTPIPNSSPPPQLLPTSPTPPHLPNSSPPPQLLPNSPPSPPQSLTSPSPHPKPPTPPSIPHSSSHTLSNPQKPPPQSKSVFEPIVMVFKPIVMHVTNIPIQDKEPCKAGLTLRLCRL
ncbi:hypothetical protein F5051DRAFT_444669 [Lentinula edodes]|nr:hypothetical protein F5051DRAFT_444669 [Lentinula edodes]